MGPPPDSKVKVPVAIGRGGGGGLIMGCLVIPNFGAGTFGWGFIGVGGRATPCVWSTPFTGGNSWRRSLFLEESEPWDDPTLMGGGLGPCGIVNFGTKGTLELDGIAECFASVAF